MIVEAMQGFGHTTMFCGDGINDLAALSAANVGMAVGATDAVIAAELATSHGSVAGQPCCFMFITKLSLQKFNDLSLAFKNLPVSSCNGLTACLCLVRKLACMDAW